MLSFHPFLLMFYVKGFQFSGSDACAYYAFCMPCFDQWSNSGLLFYCAFLTWWAWFFSIMFLAQNPLPLFVFRFHLNPLRCCGASKWRWILLRWWMGWNRHQVLGAIFFSYYVTVYIYLIKYFMFNFLLTVGSLTVQFVVSHYCTGWTRLTLPRL